MVEFVKNLLCIVVVLACFFVMIVVGRAYEDHVLCLRGQTELCIAEDFE